MAYEGCRRGWLRDLSGVLNDPFFVPMLARNISFYDETKNVRPREKVARLRRAMQKRQRAEVSSFLLMLRDIDIADDY